MEPQTATTPTKGGHVFLSHSGADSEEAKVLARAMRSVGIEVWLDVDGGLKPGDRWQAELEKALAATSAFVVYVGARGVVDWIDFEVRLAVDRAARQRDYRLISVLGPGADTARLPAVLKLFQWVDLSPHGLADPAKLQPLLDVLGAPPQARASLLPEGSRPFRGLLRFDAEDALLFFGRDAQTADLLACIGRDPFLVVVGASGCGKSSLVRAGLIPALRRGRFHDGKAWSRDWRIAITRPGSRPFEDLPRSLVNLDLAPEAEGRAARADEFSKLLASGTDGLRVAVSAYAKEGVRSLLVVDQFEEIFTLTADRDVRRRYIDNLLGAAEMAGDRPIHVVVTLRADFFDRPWEHAQLVERLRTNQYLVPRMSPDGLRAAIEGPLALAGAEADKGLTAALLADAGNEPGALALVEHALDRLWEQRESTILTHAAYDAMGRLDGALAQHANAALARLPDDATRALARRIFLELTHLGEGAPDTRRIVSLERLRELGESPEPADKTIQRLADERLIVVHETTAEVAHEALIRNWPELRGWIAADREYTRWERRTRELAEEWVRHGRNPDALMRGTPLASARKKLRETPRSPDPLVDTFVGASVKVQEAHRRVQVAQRAAIAAFVLAAAFLAYWAIDLGPRRQAAAEILKQTAAIGSLAIERRALLAAESLKRARLPEAEQIIRDALAELAKRMVSMEGTGPPFVDSLEYSPDGRRLLGFAKNLYRPGTGELVVWDASSGRRLSAGQAPIVLGPAPFRVSHDWRHVAVAHESGEIEIYYLSDGIQANVETFVTYAAAETLQESEWSSNPVQALSFSADGRLLIARHADGAVRVVDSNTGREVAPRFLSPTGHLVRALAISTDGRIAALAHSTLIGNPPTYWPNYLTTWEVATGRVISTRTVLGSIDRIYFSPSVRPGSSTIFATSGRTRFETTAACWDADRATPAIVFDRFLGWIGFDSAGLCAFIVHDQDGLHLVRYGSQSSATRIVDLPPHASPSTISYKAGNLFVDWGWSNAYFPAVGDLFGPPDVAASTTQPQKPAIRITDGAGTIFATRFSPDGSLLAVSSSSGVNVWAPPTEPRSDSMRDLIAELCTRIAKNFDAGRWTELLPDIPYEKTCPDLP